jgi:putative membrane protein
MSWLFGVLTFIRQFIFPLIAAAVVGSKDGLPSWFALLVLPMLAAALWKQYFYRYGLGPRGLVIREGVLFHNVRQIDYSRIENVDTERGPLHRLLGVAEVKVETSTGGKPEALIQVLSVQAAETLRQQIFATRSTRQEQAAAAEEEKVLLHLPIGEVIRFGLIDNRGMVVVAGIFGLLYETGMVKLWTALLKDRLDPRLLDDVVSGGWPLQAALAFGTLLATFALLRLFSMALALLTLYDFRLIQSGTDFRARYGLLTRIGLTMRVPRIQAVRQTENLVHRLLGRVSMRVDLAGDGGHAEQGEAARSRVRWLAPVTTPAHAMRLIALALPDVDMDESPHWQGLAAGARGRIFRVTMLWWMLAALLSGTLLNEWAALIVLVFGLPMSSLHAVMYVRRTRWALQPDALLYRSGWLTRKLVIVPRNRVQAAQLGESPFDRRHLMASLSVDTAGSSAGSIHIRYLNVGTAADLARALYISAAEGLVSSEQISRTARA